jgi:hypothetical protein
MATIQRWGGMASPSTERLARTAFALTERESAADVAPGRRGTLTSAMAARPLPDAERHARSRGQSDKIAIECDNNEISPHAQSQISALSRRLACERDSLRKIKN